MQNMLESVAQVGHRRVCDPLQVNRQRRGAHVRPYNLATVRSVTKNAEDTVRGPLGLKKVKPEVRDTGRRIHLNFFLLCVKAAFTL